MTEPTVTPLEPVTEDRRRAVAVVAHPADLKFDTAAAVARRTGRASGSSAGRPPMILLGTSGWQYRDWRGRFYPAGLPQRLWLEHFAGRFATVEVNNAFYRLPERDTFAAWRARTPDDFCVAVKMSRYLTHIKRLREPAEPVARFLDRATALGDRLGPVLLQLPPTLAADVPALDCAEGTGFR
ncbi:Protein of unknown function DUF72 [Micromonospora avicenniae]|uniref:DUF72 domain-containing protein n=2 Tax=Micromonospora avicenniae TaxID=1198245 RepID=A0A1N7DX06_9ACTN|nr:Protein of unknown function DUF72 [Micromonospora avicenniae]